MMKTVNKICQILSVIFAAVSLVLFFTDFVTFTTTTGTHSVVGATLGFGGNPGINGVEEMATSAEIQFCFWLTVIGLLLSVFSYKSKKVRYFAPAVGLGAGIYMLVSALGEAKYFVDSRPLVETAAPEFTSNVLFTAIALLAFAVFAVAYLLVDDRIEVLESKGAKRTILRRVIGFFKDYKSETKKIVWPGVKDVTKNTIIVIVICLIIGAFIWLLDWGLANLINAIL